jgi:hypothetical protein
MYLIFFLNSNSINISITNTVWLHFSVKHIWNYLILNFIKIKKISSDNMLKFQAINTKIKHRHVVRLLICYQCKKKINFVTHHKVKQRI